jgi:glycosyltransferase involved in cell wall biosynthesis
MSNICLVTEELSGIHGSGGIGAAFFELAVLLAENSHNVDIMYCPIRTMSSEEITLLQHRLFNYSVKVKVLDFEKYVDGQSTYERKSYAIFRSLEDADYDFIHFHDYKGLGFFSMNAKNQGLRFTSTKLVLQMHGPTRWAIEANEGFFSHEDQLKIDYMERQCTKKADIIVSPSQYLLDWLTVNNYFDCSKINNHLVIKNACGELERQYSNSQNQAQNKKKVEIINEIIFFGRHEARKGLEIFCDAVDLIKDFLETHQTKITFLGKLGKINSQDSGLYLIERSKNWNFPISVITSLDRDGAANFLRQSERSLILVGSPYENSPYAVLESVLLGKPLICSNKGGGPELLGDKSKNWSVINIDKQAVGNKIIDAINNGAPIPELSETATEISRKWLTFHKVSKSNKSEVTKKSNKKKPKVVFGITHYERPSKLIDAITSAIRQTYSNIEIIVVDDGTSTPESLIALESIETMLHRVGGRLIRQKNAYLGAARNSILRNSDSEYIIFLDDDDIALPNLTETLVCAIENSMADAVNCLNLYLNEKHRIYGITHPEIYKSRVSYVPLGGPLSIAPIENVLGSATAIFRRSSIEKIGGYSEIYGVGHEDYELFLKMIQSGFKLEICPYPLYLYEVGRIGMLLKTSLAANFRRCFNVFNFDINSEEWKDQLNLTMGKNIVINSHNRVYWINGQLSLPEIRNKILSNEYTNPTEKINDLIRISEIEGVGNIAIAFREELHRMENKIQPDKDFQVISNIFSHKTADDIQFDFMESNKKYNDQIIEIKYNLALGRNEHALNSYIVYIKDLFSISLVELVLLRDISEGFQDFEDKTTLISLREILMKKKVETVNYVILVDILVSLLISIGDIDKLIGLIDDARSQDEYEYLNSYRDVAEAVANQVIPDGVHHFKFHGNEEKWRKGYSRLMMYADAVSKVKKINLRWWDVIDYFRQ